MCFRLRPCPSPLHASCRSLSVSQALWRGYHVRRSSGRPLAEMRRKLRAASEVGAQAPHKTIGVRLREALGVLLAKKEPEKVRGAGGYSGPGGAGSAGWGPKRGKRAQQRGCWVANVGLQALHGVQGSESGLNQGSGLPSLCAQSVYKQTLYVYCRILEVYVILRQV